MKLSFNRNLVLVLLSVLLFQVASAQESRDDVEPVYSEPVERWTREERRQVRQENAEALSSIEEREERQEEEPPSFFNGGRATSIPRRPLGGYWFYDRYNYGPVVSPRINTQVTPQVPRPVRR